MLLLSNSLFSLLPSISPPSSFPSATSRLTATTCGEGRLESTDFICDSFLHFVSRRGIVSWLHPGDYTSWRLGELAPRSYLRRLCTVSILCGHHVHTTLATTVSYAKLLSRSRFASSVLIILRIFSSFSQLSPYPSVELSSQFCSRINLTFFLQLHPILLITSSTIPPLFPYSTRSFSPSFTFLCFFCSRKGPLQFSFHFLHEEKGFSFAMLSRHYLLFIVALW